MRILLLTQWFDPEPFFKGLPFVKALIARGHDVEVLTGFPNYPGGTVYDGYRIRPLRRERIDGISVLRVPLYPSHDTSSVGRILNYTSFALSAATIGAACVKRPETRGSARHRHFMHFERHELARHRLCCGAHRARMADGDHWRAASGGSSGVNAATRIGRRGGVCVRAVCGSNRYASHVRSSHALCPGDHQRAPLE